MEYFLIIFWKFHLKFLFYILISHHFKTIFPIELETKYFHTCTGQHSMTLVECIFELTCTKLKTVFSRFHLNFSGMFKHEISNMDFMNFHFLLLFEYRVDHFLWFCEFSPLIARYTFNKHDKNCIFKVSFQLRRKYPNEIRKIH